jgi:hypothetical protein
MELCIYGCGQEGKFKNKSGKYTCCEFWQQCPIKRKETSIKSKETHNTKEFKEKARKNTLRQLANETEEQKNQRIKKLKETCNTPEFLEKQRINSIKMWSDNKFREKIIPLMKKNYIKRKNCSKASLKRFKNETIEERNLRIKKAKLGSKKYFDNESDEKRNHRINSKKRTIEKLKRKHPILTKVEEMRYNPDKPGEKEIQVHCKNNNCSNSKEQGGWFTPEKREIEQRITGLNNNTSYFYCCDECKQECELFNLHSDPNISNEYNNYINLVYKSTYNSIQKYGHKIKNFELRGREFGYDLDHKYSIYDGFKNNIDHKIIGHWKNLEILKDCENRSKSKNSSIRLNELLKEI